MSHLTIEVKGKSVLVTGANRGIGKVIAETFLEQGAAKLYAAVRDPSSIQSIEPLAKLTAEKQFNVFVSPFRRNFHGHSL